MAETTTAPAAAPAKTSGAPQDSKQTAANIVNGIQRKATGTPPVKEALSQGEQVPEAIATDPNTGKEKFVVEGKEMWLTPEQAKAYVQKGLAFDRVSDQMGRMQQEVGQLYQALLTDPGKVLENIASRNKIPIESLVEKILSGRSSDQVKEVVGKWYYDTAVEPLKLTPEQLKAREDAKWRSEREKQDATAKEQAMKQQNFMRVQQEMSRIKGEIAEVMKESGLPSIDTEIGAEMARMAANYMRISRRQNQSVTPKQAAEYVRNRMRSVQSSFYDALDAEALVKELGEKNAEKVKKYFLKLAQEAGVKPVPAQRTSTPSKRDERKTISPDDFHDYLDELKRKG